MINFVTPETGRKLEQKGNSLVSESGEKFPLIKDIPRFVEQSNYAAAFGLQWKSYAKTQLDSFSKTNLSRERLERCLGMPVSSLKGKNVLEVGCGAGRFTELLVKDCANTHSVDLSNAVEVNKENIGNASNYLVAQASVYELPFPKNSFDVVICLGVIQHTPSSEKTIRALWDMVKPGGLLVIDHYMWRLAYFATLAPLYRLMLKEMSPARSKKIVDRMVDFFFPLHWKFRDNTIINWLLARISGIAFYYYQYPGFSREVYFEWCKLDTYDELTDYYKHLKRPAQIRDILSSLKGVENVKVWTGGNGVEARCSKRSI